jgi:hypothetical protein
MKKIIIIVQNILLILFVFLNCSNTTSPSNARLVDILARETKLISGDSTIIQITIYTKDGKPSLLIDDYDHATILTTSPRIESYHSMDANLSSGTWRITKIEKKPPVYGIAFTGIAPVLDFSDFLKIIEENGDTILSSSVKIYTPLGFPIIDTAIYVTRISSGLYSINSISGK